MGGSTHNCVYICIYIYIYIIHVPYMMHLTTDTYIHTLSSPMFSSMSKLLCSTVYSLHLESSQSECIYIYKHKSLCSLLFSILNIINIYIYCCIIIIMFIVYLGSSGSPSCSKLSCPSMAAYTPGSEPSS